MSTGMTRRWRLGFLASLAYASMQPGEVVSSLASIGYEAVEWTQAHFDPRATSASQRQALVDITRSGGLITSEIVVQKDLVCLDEAQRQDRIQHCLENIAAASECGVQVINLFSGPARWAPEAPVVGRDISLGTAWDQVHDAFDQLVPAAQVSGVRLAVEGVWGMLCHDYYSTLPLIEHYGSPSLGVNLDPSHDVLVGNVNSGDIVRAWGRKRIHHVHLKDAVGVPRDGEFLFPLLGEGRVPWSGFFRALEDIGYDGCCSVEFESFAFHSRVLNGDTEAAARMSYEHVMRLLDNR